MKQFIKCLAKIFFCLLFFFLTISATTFASFSNRLTLTFDEYFPYNGTLKLSEPLTVSASIISRQEDNIQTVVFQERLDVEFKNNYFSVTLGEKEEIKPSILNNPNVFLNIYIISERQSATYNIRSIPQVVVAKVAEEVLYADASIIHGKFTSTMNVKNDINIQNDGEKIFFANASAKRVGIRTFTPQYTLDVAGIVNAKEYHINGKPFKKAKAWKISETPSLIGDEDIYTDDNKIVVGEYQKSLYPLNIHGKEATINASALYQNGESLFAGMDNWIKQDPFDEVQSTDVYFPREFTENDEVKTLHFAGIGTDYPKATLDINGGLKVGLSKIPTSGVLHYKDNKFEGYVDKSDNLNREEGFKNLSGISGLGSSGKLAYWLGESSLDTQQALTSDSLFSIKETSSSSGLIRLISKDLLDSSFDNVVLHNFFKQYRVKLITKGTLAPKNSAGLEIPLTTTIKVKEMKDDIEPGPDVPTENLVVHYDHVNKGFTVMFLGKTYQADEQDQSLVVNTPGDVSLGINTVLPSTLLSIVPDGNDTAHLFSVHPSDNIDTSEPSTFLINKQGAVGVGVKTIDNHFKLDVGTTLNASNIFRNGLSISVAYAKGTYWLLNKIDDKESIYYNYGTVSIGRADPGQTNSLLKLMQTPGQGKQDNPKDNEDVGIVFSVPKGTPYIMGVDAGVVLQDDKGNYQLDEDGDRIVKQVFRVQKGTDLNDEFPLFVAEDDRFGVGVNRPGANLHVSGNTGLILSGKYDFNTEEEVFPSDLLKDTLFFFHAPRGAFRAGHLTGTLFPEAQGESLWASQNVGHFSVGVGVNAFAKGNFSTSLVGRFNQTIGPYSTILGGEKKRTNGFFNLLLGRNSTTKPPDKENDNYGTFIWSDNKDSQTQSLYNNQFVINAQNGIGVNTTNTEDTMFTVAGQKITPYNFFPMIEDEFDVEIDDVNFDSDDNQFIFLVAAALFKDLRDQLILTDENGTVTSNISALSSITFLNFPARLGNLTNFIKGYNPTSELGIKIDAITDTSIATLSNPLKDFLERMATINSVSIVDRSGKKIDTVVTNKGELIIGGTSSDGASLAVLNGRLGLGTKQPVADFSVVHDPTYEYLMLVSANNSVTTTPSFIADKFGRFGLGGVDPPTPNPQFSRVPLVQTKEVRGTGFVFPDGSRLSAEAPVVHWENDSLVKISTASIQNAVTGYDSTKAGSLLYLLQDKDYVDEGTGIRYRKKITTPNLTEPSNAFSLSLNTDQAVEVAKKIMIKKPPSDTVAFKEENFIRFSDFQTISDFSDETAAINLFKALIAYDYIGDFNDKSVCLDSSDNFQPDLSNCLANRTIKAQKEVLDLYPIPPDQKLVTETDAEYALKPEVILYNTRVAHNFDAQYLEILEHLNSIDFVGHDTVIEGDIYYTQGNVGIGTTTPNSLLEISNARLSDRYPVITIDPDKDQSNDKFSFGVNPNAPDIFRVEKITESHPISNFGTGRSPFMLKKSLVGLGTSDPKAPLTVAGKVNLSGKVLVGTTNSTTFFRQDLQEFDFLTPTINVNGKINIAGSDINPWSRRNPDGLFRTIGRLGVGGVISNPDISHPDIDDIRLVVFGRMKARNYFINNLEGKSVSLKYAYMRNSDKGVFDPEDKQQFVLKENFLYLGEKNVTNKITHTSKDSTKIIKQEGYISMFLDKESRKKLNETMGQAGLLNSPGEVDIVNNENIIVETPIFWTSEHIKRAGNDYSKDGTPDQTLCFYDNSNVFFEKCDKFPIGGRVPVLKHGKGKFEGNLVFDSTHTKSNFKAEVSRQLGITDLNVGARFSSILTNDNTLRHSGPYSLNRIHMALNDLDTNLNAPGNLRHTGLDITLSNSDYLAQNSTIFSEKSLALGLRSDVSGVEVQDIGGASKGYKFSALFLSGNVGIGTDNPVASLDVKGKMYARRFHISNSITLATMNFTAAPFRIGQDGLVGINTLSPQALLDVQGIIRAFDIETSGLRGGFYESTAAEFIAKDGRVGIGVVEPSAQLELKKTFSKSIDPSESFTFHTTSLNYSSATIRKLTGLNIELSTVRNPGADPSKSKELRDPNRFGNIDEVTGSTAKGMVIDLTGIELEEEKTLKGLDLQVSQNITFIENRKLDDAPLGINQREIAAIFMGGNVGIGTTAPDGKTTDPELHIHGGIIKANNFLGKLNYSGQLNGVSINYLVVEPESGNNDAALILGKASLTGDLVVNRLSQDTLDIPKDEDSFPFFTSTLNVTTLYGEYLVPSKNAEGGHNLTLQTAKLDVAKLLKSPKSEFDQISTGGGDLEPKYVLNAENGFEVTTLNISEKLKANALSYTDNTLVVKDQKVGFNREPNYTVDILETDDRSYVSKNVETWDGLYIQNQSMEPETVAGIQFSPKNSTDSGSGMVAIQSDASGDVAKSSSHLAFITNALDGSQHERIRFLDDGKVGINTTNPQRPLEVSGDVRASRLKLEDSDTLFVSQIEGVNNIEVTSTLNIPTTLNTTNLATDTFISLFPTKNIDLISGLQGLYVGENADLVFLSQKEGSTIRGVLSTPIESVGFADRLIFYSDSHSLDNSGMLTVTQSSEGVTRKMVTFSISAVPPASNHRTFVISSNVTEKDTPRTAHFLKSTFSNRGRPNNPATFVGLDINVTGLKGVGGKEFEGGYGESDRENHSTDFYGLQVSVNALKDLSFWDDSTRIKGKKVAAVFLNSPEEASLSDFKQSPGTVAIYTHSSYYDKGTFTPAEPLADVHIVSSTNIVIDGSDKERTDYGAFEVETEGGILGLFVSDNAKVGVGQINPNASLAIKGQAGLPILSVNTNADKTALLIDKDGKIGINNETPIADVDVAGTIKAATLNAAQINGRSLRFFNEGKGLVVTETGVGIHTETPEAQLDIYKAISAPEDLALMTSPALKKFHIEIKNEIAGLDYAVADPVYEKLKKDINDGVLPSTARNTFFDADGSGRFPFIGQEFQFNKSIDGLVITMNTQDASFGDGTSKTDAKGLNIDMTNLHLKENGVVNGIFVDVTHHDIAYLPNPADQKGKKRHAAILNGGNVGIGTLNPEFELDINEGTIKATSLIVDSGFDTNNQSGIFKTLNVKGDIPTLSGKLILTDNSKKLIVTDTLTIKDVITTSNLTLRSTDQKLSTGLLAVSDRATINRLIMGENTVADSNSDSLVISKNVVIEGDVKLINDLKDLKLMTSSLASSGTMTMPTINITNTINITEGLKTPVFYFPKVSATPNYLENEGLLFLSQHDDDIFYLIRSKDGNMVTQSITKKVTGKANQLLVFNKENMLDDELDLKYITGNITALSTDDVLTLGTSNIRQKKAPLFFVSNNITAAFEESAYSLYKVQANIDKRINKSADILTGVDVSILGPDGGTDGVKIGGDDVYTGVSVNISDLTVASTLADGTPVNANKYAALFLASPRDIPFSDFRRASGNVGIFADSNSSGFEAPLKPALADLHIHSSTGNVFLVEPKKDASDYHSDALIVSDNAYVGIGTSRPTSLLTISSNSLVDPILKIDTLEGNTIVEVKNQNDGIGNVSASMVVTGTLKAPTINGVAMVKGARMSFTGDNGSLTITDKGLVGINETSPEAQLHLKKAFPLTTDLAADFAFQSNTIDLNDTGALAAAPFKFEKDITALEITMNSTGRVVLRSKEGVTVKGSNIDLTGLHAKSKGVVVGLEVTVSKDATVDQVNETEQRFAGIFMGGKVGIGTSSPTDTLHVAGDMKLTGSFDSNTTDLNINEGTLVTLNIVADNAIKVNIAEMKLSKTAATGIVEVANVATINQDLGGSVSFSKIDDIKLVTMNELTVLQDVTVNHVWVNKDQASGVTSSIATLIIPYDNTAPTPNLTFISSPATINSLNDITFIKETTVSGDASFEKGAAMSALVFTPTKNIGLVGKFDSDKFDARFLQNPGVGKSKLFSILNNETAVGTKSNWGAGSQDPIPNDNLLFLKGDIFLNITEQLKESHDDFVSIERGFEDLGTLLVYQESTRGAAQHRSFVDDSSKKLPSVIVDTDTKFNISSTFNIEIDLNTPKLSPALVSEKFDAGFVGYEIKTKVDGKRASDLADRIFTGLNIRVSGNALATTSSGNVVGLAVRFSDEILKKSTTKDPIAEETEIIGKTLAATFMVGQYASNNVSIITSTANGLSDFMDEFKGVANATLYVKGRDESSLFRAQTGINDDSYYFGTDISPIVIFNGEEDKKTGFGGPPAVDVEATHGQSHIFFGVNSYVMDIQGRTIGARDGNEGAGAGGGAPHPGLQKRIVDLFCGNYIVKPNCKVASATEPVVSQLTDGINQQFLISSLYKNFDVKGEGFANGFLNGQLNVLAPHKADVGAQVTTVRIDKAGEAGETQAPALFIRSQRHKLDHIFGDGHDTTMIGFGTGSPDAHLEIHSKIDTQDPFFIETPTYNSKITKDGLFGIGTETPDALVHVAFDLKKVPTRSVTFDLGADAYNSSGGDKTDLHHPKNIDGEIGFATPNSISMEFPAFLPTLNIASVTQNRKSIFGSSSNDCNYLYFTRLPSENQTSTVFDFVCSEHKEKFTGGTGPTAETYKLKITKYDDLKPFIIQTKDGATKAIVVEQNGRVGIGAELYPTRDGRTIDGRVRKIDTVTPLSYDPWFGNIPTFNISYEALRVSGNLVSGKGFTNFNADVLTDADKWNSEFSLFASSEENKFVVGIGLANNLKKGSDSPVMDKNYIAALSKKENTGLNITTDEDSSAMYIAHGDGTTKVGVGNKAPGGPLHIVGDGEHSILRVQHEQSGEDLLAINKDGLVQISYGNVDKVDTSEMTDTVLDVRHPRFTETTFVGNFNSDGKDITFDAAAAKEIYEALSTVDENMTGYALGMIPILDENGFLQRALISLHNEEDDRTGETTSYLDSLGKMGKPYDLLGRSDTKVGLKFFWSKFDKKDFWSKVCNSDRDTKVACVTLIYREFMNHIQSTARIDEIESISKYGLKIEAERGLVIKSHDSEEVTVNGIALNFQPSVRTDLGNAAEQIIHDISIELGTDYGMGSNPLYNKFIKRDLAGLEIVIANNTGAAIVGTPAASPNAIIGLKVDIDSVNVDDPIRIKDDEEQIIGKRVAATFLGGNVYMGGASGEAYEPTINGLLQVRDVPLEDASINNNVIARFDVGLNQHEVGFVMGSKKIRDDYNGAHDLRFSIESHDVGLHSEAGSSDHFSAVTLNINDLVSSLSTHKVAVDLYKVLTDNDATDLLFGTDGVIKKGLVLNPLDGFTQSPDGFDVVHSLGQEGNAYFLRTASGTDWASPLYINPNYVSPFERLGNTAYASTYKFLASVLSQQIKQRIYSDPKKAEMPVFTLNIRSMVWNDDRAGVIDAQGNNDFFWRGDYMKAGMGDLVLFGNRVGINVPAYAPYLLESGSSGEFAAFSLGKLIATNNLTAKISRDDHPTALIVSGNIRVGVTSNSTEVQNFSFGNRVYFSDGANLEVGERETSEMWISRYNGAINNGESGEDKTALRVNVGQSTQPSFSMKIGHTLNCYTKTSFEGTHQNRSAGTTTITSVQSEDVFDALRGRNVSNIGGNIYGATIQDHGNILDEDGCKLRELEKGDEWDTLSSTPPFDVLISHISRALIDDLSEAYQHPLYNLLKPNATITASVKVFKPILTAGVYENPGGDSTEGRTMLIGTQNNTVKGSTYDEPVTVFHLFQNSGAFAIKADINDTVSSDKLGTIGTQEVEIADDKATANNYVMFIDNMYDGPNPNHAADIMKTRGPQGLAIQLTNIQAPTIGSNYITFIATNNAIQSDTSRVGEDVGILGAIEGNGTGGVQFTSQQADYAEYLPKLDPEESFKKGDIVSVVNGKISKSTTGFDQLLVISTGPIVVGNWPGNDEENNYELVAFLGQVNVNVLGQVNAGDYIIPSGRDDGTGIAVSQDALLPEQIDKIIGRSWESHDEFTSKQVNVVVGFPFQFWAMAEKYDDVSNLEQDLEILRAQKEAKQKAYRHTLKKRQDLINKLKKRVARIES